MSGTEIGGQAASSSSSSDRFHFLRSLRDVLFGRRRHRPRGWPTTNDATRVARVKSSRSLDDDLQSTTSADTDNDVTRLVSAAASSTASTADVTRQKYEGLEVLFSHPYFRRALKSHCF